MIYGVQSTISALMWLNRKDVINEILKEDLVRRATNEGYKIIGEIKIEEPKSYFKFLGGVNRPVNCEATDEEAVCFVNVKAEIE